MKRKFIRTLKIGIFLLGFGLTVFIGGYLYLNSMLNKAPVSENVSRIPYYSSPENTVILFNICEDEILLRLNFDEETVDVLFCDQDSADYGLNPTKTVNCDYEIVGYFTDIIGGMEINNQRYTGAHITEMLEFSYVSQDIKRIVTEKILDGISENGFTRENILYLIENSDTDLKFNECYFWSDYIQTLCKFPKFIN